MPDADVFESWRDRVDDRFVFAVKANRYLTHMKKLKDAAEPLGRFLERARILGEKLGPLLYQLPPRWHRDVDRLAAFADLLPDDLVHVFEFRDPTWHDDAVFDLLAERGLSFCTHDMEGLDPPRKAIGPVAYVRFHGTKGKYRGGYPEQSLRPWAKWLEGEHDDGRDVYAYFNNDIEGHAVHDARILQKKLTGSRDR